MFDPQNGTWKRTAHMINGRYGHALLATNGKLYAVGGYAADTYEQMAKVEMFDPVKASWTAVAHMLTARAGFGAGVGSDGALYVAGGSVLAPDTVTDKAERYDPVKNTWTAIPPMPTTRQNCGGGVIGGFFYVLGGSGGEFFEDLRSTDQFTINAVLPVGRTVR